jgi:hypothetical protein
VKTAILLLLFSIASSTLTAQKRAVNFSFQASGEKIANSRYTIIQVLDSRQDSNLMGFVQKRQLRTEPEGKRNRLLY